MEIERLTEKDSERSVLSQVLITSDDLKRHIHEINCSRSDYLQYRLAYNTGLRTAYRALRALRREVDSCDFKPPLTRLWAETLTQREAPNDPQDWLARRYYLTVASRSLKESGRLTRYEVFVFGRLFTEQSLWSQRVFADGRKSLVGDLMEMPKASTVTYSFGRNEIVDEVIEPHEDGSLPFINTNLAMERAVYDELSQRFRHWPDCVRSLDTSIVVVG